MWLLNASSWEIKDFISPKETPPYAILSHTWGEEEASFRDWQPKPGPEVRNKLGYRKIEYCCKQSIADGYGWVWIDTCCIDKSSSAELSEAINSMFQWYADAAICYAYLNDVILPANATEDDIKSLLAVSRWLTRGWTLQELIAPPNITFYSSDWEAFGTRLKLSATLAEIALIDESYLNGRSLNDASVAQRMSWASRRTTSREEDLAYCLLGIFNVNIPLIYGEKSKAFRRLQEAIIREYPEDHSLYAWGQVVKRPSQKIVDRNQIWGLKPIEYNPDLADQKLLSLLAESPADFKHSGQIVRAPLANAYFDHGNELYTPPFSIGHATQVEFPTVPWEDYAAFHLKRPPIVQIRIISYALLLCGRWNEKRNKFHFVLIPQVVVGAQVSRTYEIIIDRKMKPLVTYLKEDTQRYIYKVPRPYLPRKGGLLFRRAIYSIADLDTKLRQDVIDAVRYNWLNPPCSVWRMLHATAFEADRTHTFAVFIRRQGPVDGESQDRDNDAKNGMLKFGLAPIKISSKKQDVQRRHSTRTQQEPKPLTERSKEIPPFSDVDSALQYFWDCPDDIPHQHEMAVPQDEWRLNIEDYVDVSVAVERMYIDDDDSDEYTTEREPGCYVDVIDLIVRVKGDPGYRNLEGKEEGGLKDRGDQDQDEDEGSDDGANYDR
ncbi:heterokaryon incompatibility protein-domain-containing protein [Nemania sp. FL0031]|nr:heterokaryon incompatibility protein-domain-containing protein [Nemania sp. FL0031]